MGLAVHDQSHSLVDVGVSVDVHVTVAHAGFDHRDGGVLDDVADQRFAPTRNQHIDEAVGRHQVLHRFVGISGNELHSVGVQSLLGQRRTHRGDQRLVAVHRRGRSTQQRGVPALEAETGGIDGDVRSGLVDHSDHADRDAHLTDLQTIRQGVSADHFTDRIREGSHVP